MPPKKRTVDVRDDDTSSSSRKNKDVGFTLIDDDDDDDVEFVVVSKSTPAVSRSSDAVRIPTTPTYYFWTFDCTSHTREEMDAITRRMLETATPLDLATNRCTTTTPRGRVISMPFMAHAVHFTDRTPIVDVSRTAGATECSITLDPFEEPHLLNFTGRSYSKKAITNAIERTLKRGENLRLEELTIDYTQLDQVVLYPNYSLPGWTEPLRYSAADVFSTKKFDHDLAARENIEACSAWFDAIPSPDKQMWDITGVFAQYLHHRPYQTKLGASNDTAIFRNMILRNIVFPRWHPKQRTHMCNVEFRECLIHLQCLCGLRMFGCKFTNCVIVRDISYAKRSDSWNGCIFDGCRTVVGTHTPDNDEFQYLIHMLHGGGTYNGLPGRFIPCETIPLELACTASYASLMRRVDIAIGQATPRADDPISYRPIIGGKWAPLPSK